MRTKTGLTSKDKNFINSTCRSIAKFDKHGVSEIALRQQIYMLGLFTFRQFYKAGFPSDYKNPSLNNLANVSRWELTHETTNKSKRLDLNSKFNQS